MYGRFGDHALGPLTGLHKLWQRCAMQVVAVPVDDLGTRKGSNP